LGSAVGLFLAGLGVMLIGWFGCGAGATAGGALLRRGVDAPPTTSQLLDEH